MVGFLRRAVGAGLGRRRPAELRRRRRRRPGGQSEPSGKSGGESGKRAGGRGAAELRRQGRTAAGGERRGESDGCAGRRPEARPKQFAGALRSGPRRRQRERPSRPNGAEAAAIPPIAASQPAAARRLRRLRRPFRVIKKALRKGRKAAWVGTQRRRDRRVQAADSGGRRQPVRDKRPHPPLKSVSARPRKRDRGLGGRPEAVAGGGGASRRC